MALIELKSATEEPLPKFDAGDHVDMHLADGLIRQYSISNAPGQRDVYRFGVLLTNRSRGGARAMHALKVGDQFEISCPRNAFKLQEEAKKSILVGGGIGITPLLAMAYRLEEIGADFELHYCARTKLDAAFRKAILKTPFGRKVVWHFDGANGLTSFDPDTVLQGPDDQHHLYVCGPIGFMEFVREGASRCGWPDSNVHFEAFEPSEDMAHGEAFEVFASRSDKLIKVRSNQSAAQALEENGIRVSVSCEQGICGTCLVPIIEGAAIHRDSYQTESEKNANTQFALCCSRASTGRIVLDV
ncbi:PDR/VanB family oxidoreductase [Roseibium sp. M-1]